RIADTAVQRFGGFDTWVNDAGVAIWGKLEEVSDEDSRRLFDTNFWGTVYGSVIAARHLRPRGGALINLGSEVSEVAVPIQGMYAASKHAVKGFTDSLRMELEIDRAPALHQPKLGGRIHGDHPGHVMSSSLYTRAVTHPVTVGATGALLAVAAGAAVALLAGGSSGRRS